MEKVENLSHNYTGVNKLTEQMVLPYLLDGINGNNPKSKSNLNNGNTQSNMTNNTSIAHVQQANGTTNGNSDIILTNIQQSFVNNLKQVGSYVCLFFVEWAVNMITQFQSHFLNLLDKLEFLELNPWLFCSILKRLKLTSFNQIVDSFLILSSELNEVFGYFTLSIKSPV